MSKQFYRIPFAFDDAKFHKLSDGAKLLYGRLVSLGEGQLSKKAGGSSFASNKTLSELTGKTERTIGRYVEELKEWNLISTSYVKKELTKTTRYIKTLPVKDACKQPTELSTEEWTDLSVAVDTSVSSSRQNCQKQWTPESTIIKKDNTKNNKKVNIPKEPLLVDNEVKKINFLDMKKNDKEFNLFFRKHILQDGWKANQGWKELLCTLTKDEVNQMETYLEANRLQDRDYRPTIDEVIQGRLYVTQ